MKISQILTTSILSACLAFAITGCGHKHSHGEGHDEHAEHEEKDSGGGHGHSHGADAKSFSGATHKEGQGITLLPETKERLGIKLEEVREERLPREIAFTARVFAADEKGQFQASGILSADNAEHLKEGSKIKLQTRGGDSFEGTVLKSSNPISTNETEVIVRFAAPQSTVGLGSFLRVAASVAAEGLVTTIPKEALIKGTTECFVYVKNDDAYLRTVVKPGRETADSIEIQDGLFEGDSVVSKGAMDLWLVELRAVKGGQGCCPAPPVKGKKT